MEDLKEDLLISRNKEKYVRNIQKLIVFILSVIAIISLGIIYKYIVTNNPLLGIKTLIFFIIVMAADIFVLYKFIHNEVQQINMKLAKLEEENLRLKEEVLVDKLTGAFNRRKLQEIADIELERSKRYSIPISIIIFDIDDFKKINDKHGHSRGDIVLKNITKVITSKLRKTDFFIRWGGEEFVILAPETNIQGALILGEKIRKLVSENIYVALERVTVSVGVAEYKKELTYKEFFDNADKALYIAKNSGKNNVKFVD
ncbi:diguanylate cyclase [Clostridium sp. YIM B02505]|uniref:Diguanylate cyclase n=1 Tax=Clostridium yunnanense TaxID=2800325 RepID=A0ABS1EWP8_9CLOT|nr:diguanylate cyclase [Clostridium yunnanense]